MTTHKKAQCSWPDFKIIQIQDTWMDLPDLSVRQWSRVLWCFWSSNIGKLHGSHPVIFGGCQLLRNKAFRNSWLPKEDLLFPNRRECTADISGTASYSIVQKEKRDYTKMGLNYQGIVFFCLSSLLGQVPGCFVTEVTVYCQPGTIFYFALANQ